jgi:ferredoxin-NADP reductase
MTDPTLPDDHFWHKTFFSEARPTSGLARRKHDPTASPSAKIEAGAEFWVKRLFEGAPPDQNPGDKLAVLKDGLVIHEIPLARLGPETVIGRHPDADLQLESYRLGMYHAALRKRGGRLYVEGLDHETGTLLNRRKLEPNVPVPLWDGSQVDLPGFRLEFSIADAPPPPDGVEPYGEEPDDIPHFFYSPPPPPASPVLANLVEQRSQIGVWSEGTTILKVADIIDETHDTKTFRLVGEEPLLFSYRPGQFVTFLLDIDGREVKRSYSMSSSPSRPHVLEATIKRVPGGLVSNWFCDRIKLGDRLTVKGPSGKFTCFDYPSGKMLFIGAGSGITPIVSMGRWIADTAADVDVKLLASFKSPSDIIFRKEFELWAARSRRFQVAITLTSDWHGTDFWTGFRGRISEEMLQVFAPDLHERHVFLCGPEPFADSVRKILQDAGFDLARLHTESFGSGRSAQGSTGGGRTLELKGPTHKVAFAKSGITVDTDEHLSLLELAEAHGIEIEYSCRSGSCGACEVKCRGEVKMDPDCGIDDRSKAAGFVYACCCRALGNLELEA